MLEKPNSLKIIAQLSKLACVRLFRNNVGVGWVANASRVLADDSVILKNWRRIRFGLFPGSSDYIGWKSVVITQEMVGRRVAVFLAIETKRAAGGKKQAEQRHFISTVKEAGGLAGFVSTQQDAQKIIGSL